MYSSQRMSFAFGDANDLFHSTAQVQMPLSHCAPFSGTCSNYSDSWFLLHSSAQFQSTDDYFPFFYDSTTAHPQLTFLLVLRSMERGSEPSYGSIASQSYLLA